METDAHYQHPVFIIYTNPQKGLPQALVELPVYLQTRHCVRTQEWGQGPICSALQAKIDSPTHILSSHCHIIDLASGARD